MFIHAVIFVQVFDGVHVFVAVCVLHNRRVRRESGDRSLLHGDSGGCMVRY